jgi:hypothetical protein
MVVTEIYSGFEEDFVPKNVYSLQDTLKIFVIKYYILVLNYRLQMSLEGIIKKKIIFVLSYQDCAINFLS